MKQALWSFFFPWRFSLTLQKSIYMIYQSTWRSKSLKALRVCIQNLVLIGDINCIWQNGNHVYAMFAYYINILSAVHFSKPLWALHYEIVMWKMDCPVDFSDETWKGESKRGSGVVNAWERILKKFPCCCLKWRTMICLSCMITNKRFCAIFCTKMMDKYKLQRYNYVDELVLGNECSISRKSTKHK